MDLTDGLVPRQAIGIATGRRDQVEQEFSEHPLATSTT
jgi:hypothetical protein